MQSLAEVELLLTEELRSFHPSDLRIGAVAFRGMRVDALPADLTDNDAYLIRVNYELGFESEAPVPTWTEIGLGFLTPGVIVSDALPRAVQAESPPERYAVTKNLDFIRYEPDLAGRVLHDQVPVPAQLPVLDSFGIGGPTVRWRRSQRVRAGSHVGWLTLVTQAGCQEVEIRVDAGYGLERADTWGMHPRGRPDAFTVRLPFGPLPVGVTIQFGFTVDIVGYSTRTIPRQQQAQERLLAIFDAVMADAGLTVDPRYFQPTGDGFNVFLPPTTDVHAALRHLLTAMPRRLAESNRANDDRLRLRMALDIGTVGPGHLGLVADAIINFCRLVDSEPIRHAVTEYTDADLAILASDTVHAMVVTRFDDLAALPFVPVDVQVKGYRSAAHLLVLAEPN